MPETASRVVTRFAPSPTGFLHIGGARTALFNWLFAKHHGGSYRLRIEDTDRKRSTDEAIEAILDGLDWLGLDWDGDVFYQSKGAERHAALARELLAQGKAYHCYCSPEELDAMRQAARAEGRPVRYDGRWRDRDPSEAPDGIDPVVRIKMPQEGSTVINDLVQGEVTVGNDQLDDMVLLRADGTPTYMLSVVVDDHDMGVTHVIRGDDHLTNAFRQYQLYRAFGWDVPAFAHIPLIHGPDGAKLSKRHGALGVEAYRDMGYLPEALCNYLLRLGWGHGDDEIISIAQAIEWFDLDGVGKSASRFDFAKLENLNGVYLREAEGARLTRLVCERMASEDGQTPDESAVERLGLGIDGLKLRAKTLNELVESARVYTNQRPLTFNPKAQKILSEEAVARLAAVKPALEALESWDESTIEAAVRDFAESAELKLGNVAQPLRASITGSNVSPGIFEVMSILGKEECLARISDVL
ncbi:glutamate--tRNA ligase [Denitrobaculum tricleocarpae]|uniref:Glutamate--tRNA ligase n=1 Tax=Denitrobaculum tricleocarpae TaxID=2591009 RepID=A0A545TPJ2_9PROT|nr:glutamate--tRNA ligase [Denitrobaculum tricleocarpae]TQV79134.1 glutamate--tRNA ligase [Denitrobaculum tricleocarpae]